jgi:hypothetical protein
MTTPEVTLQDYANKKFIETFERYEAFYFQHHSNLNNNLEIQQLRDQLKEKDEEITKLKEHLETKAESEPEPEPETLKEDPPASQPIPEDESVDETVGEFLYEKYVKPKREAEVLKGTLFDEYILFCLENNLVILKRPAFYKEVKKAGIKERRTNKQRLFIINFTEPEPEPEPENTIEIDEVSFANENESYYEEEAPKKKNLLIPKTDLFQQLLNKN